MIAPFIHIATFTIKDGQLEGLKQFLPQFFRVIEENHPRMLAINAYLNEDGNEATLLQVHPDAASMEHYAQVVHEHTGRALGQFVETTISVQVYGETSDAVRERAQQHAGSGVVVSVKPGHLGGFARSR